MSLEPGEQIDRQLKPSGRINPVEVLNTINTGQTRYEELREELDIPEPVLDHELIRLAKTGEVSLLAIGNSLVVKPE